jgi:hypothetical protein
MADEKYEVEVEKDGRLSKTLGKMKKTLRSMTTPQKKTKTGNRLPVS